MDDYYDLMDSYSSQIKSSEAKIAEAQITARKMLK